MFGPLLFVACFGIALLGVSSAGLAIARHRSRGVRGAMAGIGGAVLVWAWAIGFVGVMETGWGPARGAACTLLGAAGAVCVALAVRAAWRPKFGPSKCQRCGYELGGVPRCPECGIERNA